MKSKIDKIKELLDFLSERDREISEQLIKNKNFHNARELVYSSIYKLKKPNRDSPIDERVIMLELLYSELDSYIILIYGEDGRDEVPFEELELEFNENIEDI